jgi:hypothetical protein
MLVLSYYTCFLQLILITIRFHRRLLLHSAGAFGMILLILLFLTGSILLNRPDVFAEDVLAMLGYW